MVGTARQAPGGDVTDSGISVQRAPRDFQQWETLLALLRAAFAYQEQRIDPPSSVRGLDTASLR
jgi:hypothetical protein